MDWLTILSYGEGSAATSDGAQRLAVEDDKTAAADLDETAFAEFFDGHRNPLPGRADHRGKFFMRGHFGDDRPAAGFNALQIGQIEQQISQSLDDRTRAEHLQQREIAFALVGQALHEPDGEVGMSDISRRTAAPGKRIA